jgi:hypothetical protein
MRTKDNINRINQSIYLDVVDVSGAELVQLAFQQQILHQICSRAQQKHDRGRETDST